MVEGTYDEFHGSHMSWTPMILDEQGRKEIAEILERALLEAIAVQESTKERLASCDEAGVSYTVSIMGYPSLGGEKKVGPPTGAQELATATADLASEQLKKVESQTGKVKGRTRKPSSKRKPKAKRNGSHKANQSDSSTK